LSSLGLRRDRLETQNYESVGQRFESSGARHPFNGLRALPCGSRSIPLIDIPRHGILHIVAILGFASRQVERFFADGQLPKRVGWGNVAKVARRKLDILDYASTLADLASPPGNRLEALKGDLEGFHSIRVNDQWRVVFRWTTAGPEAVDIQDYH